jgi:rSAM/selenodomain-associated transferase 2
MNPAPRLSVIIPTLDEEARIVDLLNDLATLRADGHEIILVDGGSRDSTLQTAAPLVDRALRAPRGRASQMNAGAAGAGGDLLWFLHADARVPAGAAARLLEAFAAGHRWGRFDVRLSGRQWLLRVIEVLMNLRSRMTGIATGDQGIFVSREAFDEVHGYPAIPLMEDIALSKALRRLGRPYCVRRPRLQTSSRRWEERGILRTVLLMWRLRLAYALGARVTELADRYR